MATIKATEKRAREAPTENPNEEQCSYYVARKHRFCRTERKAGSKFCCTHHVEEDANRAATQPGEVDAARAPCPINPNHTVYVSRLAKHVKVCPDLRYVASNLPYYEENKHAFHNLSAEDPLLEGGEAAKTALSPPAALSEDHLKELIQRVMGCYEKNIEPWLVHTGICPGMPLPASRCSGISCSLETITSLIGQEESQKHSPQLVSLLLMVSDAITASRLPMGSKITGFLELGAGKGSLAVALQRLLTAYGKSFTSSTPGEEEPVYDPSVHKTLSAAFPFLPQYLGKGRGEDGVGAPDYPHIAVIDMQTFRRKGDAKVRHTAVPLQRLRLNIKDLHLTKAFETVIKSPASDGSCSDPATLPLKEWVGVGKHLCGACTEFALSCLTEPSLSTAAHVSIRCVVIATCCHHRCSYAHMLRSGGAQGSSADSLELPHTDFSLTSSEFAAVARMSSWAVSGEQTTPEKRRIGNACKRIIDSYRVGYLESHGYRAYLATYVPPSVTEENVCIVACK